MYLNSVEVFTGARMQLVAFMTLTLTPVPLPLVHRFSHKFVMIYSFTPYRTIYPLMMITATIASSLEQDPKLLQENNRRLAQELSRARMDMRDMHNHHEKERQDLQDEIVRLRQLAGK